MKRSFIMLGVIFLINMESNAQQESQLIATNSLSTTKPVSFSIQSYGGPDKDADFYLRRSKNYRIVGWSTLGAGLIASGAGLLLASNNSNYYNSSNEDGAAVLFLVGAVSGITSIPFMIMATSYKHKAKAMVSSQKTGFGVPGNVSKDIVGITLQIPLGK